MKRTGGFVSLFMVSAALLMPRLYAGCCVATRNGGAVYSAGTTDTAHCSNVNGTLESEESCAAKAGKATFRSIA